MMQRLLILAAIAVCCLAAPAVNNEENSKDRVDRLLQRPSPINPDVISDPKPEDKIIMLDDPKESIKHKRDVDQEQKDDRATHLEPNVQPQYEHTHHTQLQDEQAHVNSDSEHHNRQRRDQKSQPAHDDKSPSHQHQHEQHGQQEKSAPHSHSEHQSPHNNPAKQIAPTPPQSKHRQRRDTASTTSSSSTPTGPSIARVPLTHGQSVHVACLQNGNACAHADQVAPQTLPGALDHHDALKPQTLPLPIDHAVPHEPHTHSKRDIPVPLVPKHEHSDESKEDGHVQVEDLNGQVPVQHNDEQGSSSSTTNADGQSSTTVHPVIRHHPVPVAELFGRSSI